MSQGCAYRDHWKEEQVRVPLLLPRESYKSEDAAPHITLDVAHRKITEIVRSAYEDPTSASLIHWKSFVQMWKPSPDKPAERVYSEGYTSNMYRKLKHSITPVPGCNLERTVAAIMIYSDGTKLTNFGFASLWPAYIWIAGISKNILAKPDAHMAHHLAYFPLVCLFLA